MLRSPEENVCGASLNAHWGVDHEKGVFSTHVLAKQIIARYSTEKLGRTRMLVRLAKQLEKYRGLQTAWMEQRAAAKAAVEEAQREIQAKNDRIEETKLDTARCVEEYKRKLGAMYKGMCKEIDDMKVVTNEKQNLLAESEQRHREQKVMIENLEGRNAALKQTLEKTVGRLSEVQTVYSVTSAENRQFNTFNTTAPSQAPELERATNRVAALTCAKGAVERDLCTLRAEVMHSQDDLNREHEHALRLEAFIRRVALSPPGTLRTGGGFVVDMRAKQEAAALIREAARLGVPVDEGSAAAAGAA